MKTSQCFSSLFISLSLMNNQPREGLGKAYDRLVFDRTFLIWWHGALGLSIGAIYSYREPIVHLHYWTRGAGVRVLLKACLVMWPYAASAYGCYNLAAPSQLRFWWFSVVLLLGSFALGTSVLVSPAVAGDKLLLIVVSVLLYGIYAGAANALLERREDF